jgi:hypothetical protein
MTIDTNETTSRQPEAEPPARRSVTIRLPTRRIALVGVVAAIVLGLVATVTIESVYISRHHGGTSQSSLPNLGEQAGGGSGTSSLDAVRSSAVQAATTYTVAFATYNYQHLGQDFGVTEAHAVDPFLTQYRKETASIRPDLVKLKSISTGKVLSAAAVSVTPTTAVVDLFLDQTIVNSASAKPHVDSQRVQMSLRRTSTSAAWQITKVTLP